MERENHKERRKRHKVGRKGMRRGQVRVRANNRKGIIIRRREGGRIDEREEVKRSQARGSEGPPTSYLRPASSTPE